MANEFFEIDPKDLQFNPFDAVGDGMLVTAGNDSAYNTMTAAWGQLGILWGQPVATIYLRPQRYTKEFVDSTDDFTLSFFDESWADALELCGTKSGRDTDKALATGLSPVQVDGSMAFEQAQLVIVCHKLYAQTLDKAAFTAPKVYDENYPEGDLHTMYVGRIDHMYLAASMVDDEGEDDGCECGHHGHHHHDGDCCCHHHDDE